MNEYRSPYLPETCTEPDHVPGCPGKAGGDHEFLQVCPTCGSTETREISTDGPPEQSITICAECGSDEPWIQVDGYVVAPLVNRGTLDATR